MLDSALPVINPAHSQWLCIAAGQTSHQPRPGEWVLHPQKSGPRASVRLCSRLTDETQRSDDPPSGAQLWLGLGCLISRPATSLHTPFLPRRSEAAHPSPKGAVDSGPGPQNADLRTMTWKSAKNLKHRPNSTYEEISLGAGPGSRTPDLARLFTEEEGSSSLKEDWPRPMSFHWLCPPAAPHPPSCVLGRTCTCGLVRAKYLTFFPDAACALKDPCAASVTPPRWGRNAGDEPRWWRDPAVL